MQAKMNAEKEFGGSTWNARGFGGPHLDPWLIFGRPERDDFE